MLKEAKKKINCMYKLPLIKYPESESWGTATVLSPDWFGPDTIFKVINKKWPRPLFCFPLGEIHRDANVVVLTRDSVKRSFVGGQDFGRKHIKMSNQ